MTCLTLSRASVNQWRADAKRFASFTDCVELRIDLLRSMGNAAIISEVAAFARSLHKPTILTVRRVADGGAYDGPEADRLDLLNALVESVEPTYVDLESDLTEVSGAAVVEETAGRIGTRIIRSLHDLQGVPTDPCGALDSLASKTGEIPKLAVAPQGTRDLHRVFRAYSHARREFGGDFILLGMGRFGFPTRILAPALGALLTFTSVPGAEAAPGHIDPETMRTVYLSNRIGSATRIYGIIGNPVLHSRSPHYHNPRFAKDGIDAVYVPFPTDDVAEFFELAATLSVQGFSVTIPHKESVMRHLVSVDEGSEAAGACNTVIRNVDGSTRNGRAGGGFRGVNTDIPGFLAPLRELFGADGIAGKRATVIGAGGAARAVCYALVAAGVSVLVLNRTPARSARLAREIEKIVAAEHAEIRSGPLDASGFAAAADFRDIVVQTTGVGMAPNVEADPAEGLSFGGTEVVYDIIYTPEYTRFLRRAERSGCRVVTGAAMFARQAEEQYRLFLSVYER